MEDAPDDWVSDAFMETAFAGQAIGRPILGTPDTIRSFDGEAIRSFMARAYAPGRMVFAAAGPLEHEAIVAAVARHFGDLPPVEPPLAEPGRYTGGERRRLRKLEQANVMLGFPGVSFKDPAYYATHLFAQVLGGGLTSRLWHEVRETLRARLRGRRLPLALLRLRPVRDRRGDGGEGPGPARRGRSRLRPRRGAGRRRRRDRAGQGAAQGGAADVAGNARAAASSAPPARSWPGTG